MTTSSGVERVSGYNDCDGDQLTTERCERPGRNDAIDEGCDDDDGLLLSLIDASLCICAGHVNVLLYCCLMFAFWPC